MTELNFEKPALQVVGDGFEAPSQETHETLPTEPILEELAKAKANQDRIQRFGNATKEVLAVMRQLDILAHAHFSELIVAAEQAHKAAESYFEELEDGTFYSGLDEFYEGLPDVADRPHQPSVLESHNRHREVRRGIAETMPQLGGARAEQARQEEPVEMLRAVHDGYSSITATAQATVTAEQEANNRKWSHDTDVSYAVDEGDMHRLSDLRKSTKPEQPSPDTLNRLEQAQQNEANAKAELDEQLARFEVARDHFMGLSQLFTYLTIEDGELLARIPDFTRRTAAITQDITAKQHKINELLREVQQATVAVRSFNFHDWFASYASDHVGYGNEAKPPMVTDLDQFSTQEIEAQRVASAATKQPDRPMPPTSHQSTETVPPEFEAEELIETPATAS